MLSQAPDPRAAFREHTPRTGPADPRPVPSAPRRPRERGAPPSDRPPWSGRYGRGLWGPRPGRDARRGQDRARPTRRRPRLPPGRCAGPRVLGADTRADVPRLATELVEGPSLGRRLGSAGPLSGKQLTTLATGVLAVLRDLRSQGVVHRDLKPGNVILGAGGPKVVDFGIARALDGTALTRTGGLVGSPGWIAPERHRQGISTPAADVFSWGALVAFAATGRPPFGQGTPSRGMVLGGHGTGGRVAGRRRGGARNRGAVGLRRGTGARAHRLGVPGPRGERPRVPAGRTVLRRHRRRVLHRLRRLPPTPRPATNKDGAAPVHRGGAVDTGSAVSWL